MEQRKGKKLVLFPLPLQGHINPMLQLANILHYKGFSITILHTNFNSSKLNQTNYPHFAFHSIQETLINDDTNNNENVISLVGSLVTNCVDPFKNCLTRLMLEEPICCLISDALFYFTQGVASELNVPRLVLRTGGVSSFLVFSGFELLEDSGYFSTSREPEEPVLEFPPLKVKDLPLMNKGDNNSIEFLCQLVRNMVNGAKKSSGLIFNTFKEFEESSLDKLLQEFNTTPIFTIGPFHKLNASMSTSPQEQANSVVSWLDRQEPKSVIYVSFGSIAQIKEADFLEIAYGLANTNHPFLWVVRPGLVDRSSSGRLEPVLPDGFLESLEGRGHIVQWAPQLEVLAHPAIGLFWTHCGWNSTLECVSEGVPMLCMPCFADQKVNARFVSDVWRIGILMEDGLLEREYIAKCIKRLMDDEESEVIRKRSLGFKEKVSSCVCYGGSSLGSLDSLVSHILSLNPIVFQAN